MPVILTFGAGLLALSTWIYLRGFDRAARSILIIGLLYLLLADLIGATLSLIGPLALDGENEWSVLMLVLLVPLVEEGVKVRAAKSRTVPSETFALVSLFGIYELMLGKPFSMIGAQEWYEFLTAVPALVMHLVTASIYAFHFKGNHLLQFMTCFVVHAGFNALVFEISSASASSYYAIFFLIFMALAAAVIWLLPSKVWLTGHLKGSRSTDSLD